MHGIRSRIRNGECLYLESSNGTMKTPTNKKKVRSNKVLSLEDAAHFIIYRELDKLRVPFPYEKATAICRELREIVQYRSALRTPKSPTTPPKRIKE